MASIAELESTYKSLVTDLSTKRSEKADKNIFDVAADKETANVSGGLA